MARATVRSAQNSDERLIGLYLDMLAAERGAGDNTLGAYGRDLEDLSNSLKAAHRSIAKARTADLRAYLEELSRRGLRVATVARRLSAIRQLYRFLYAEGHRADDPAAVLEGPKRERALPKTLTLAEVDHLLRLAGQCDPAAPLPARLRAARLACLVEMLYATGLRVSELVTLPISAARRDARVIVVRGKGNKNAWCRSTMPPNARRPTTLRSLRSPSATRYRNGCFHRSAKAGISRANIWRAN